MKASGTQKSEQCPNCGHPLNGENFCPNCGQKNDLRKPTIWQFIHESFSNIFAFEGRFFQTFWMLIRYPGKVPREYMAGKRIRYMDPLRLYIWCSVLLIFSINMDSYQSIFEIHPPGAKERLINNNTFSDSASASLGTGATHPIQDTSGAFHVSLSNNGFSGKLNRMSDFYKAHPSMPVRQALDSLHIEQGIFSELTYVQIAKANYMDTDNYWQFFQSKLFWVLFLFLPLLALWLKLLYIRHNIYYLEHLYFALYTQSIFFIFLVLLTTLHLSGGWDLLVILLFGVYLFTSLRGFYRQSLGKTTLKFILLNMGGVIFFAVFFAISLFIVFILFSGS